jgi:hypothetical protein
VESRVARVEIDRTSRSHGKVFVGRALLAAFSGSVSVAVVGAVIGLAVTTSTPVPVAATTGRLAVASSAPAPSVSRAAAAGLTDAAFARGIASGLSQGVGALQRYATTTKPASSSVPIDPGATRAGLAKSGYTFTAEIVGLADLGTLGSSVRGAVTDATHFTVEFPDSTSITRYERDGDAAFAWIDGRRLTLAAGAGGMFGTLSPEDFLPATLWSMAVGQWADLLQPGAAAGEYVAPSAALTAKARLDGYGAKDWTLRVRLDQAGRLTALGFAGTSFSSPFGLDVAIAYS